VQPSWNSRIQAHDGIDRSPKSEPNYPRDTAAACTCEGNLELSSWYIWRYNHTSRCRCTLCPHHCSRKMKCTCDGVAITHTAPEPANRTEITQVQSPPLPPAFSKNVPICHYFSPSYNYAHLLILKSIGGVPSRYPAGTLALSRDDSAAERTACAT
jgi:hypothetical protein